MRKEIISPFKSWWEFLLANLLLGFVCSFFFINNYSVMNILIGGFWGMCISLTQWLGHAYLQIKIEQKYSWLEYPGRRVVLTFLSILFYSVFAYLTVQSLMNLIFFNHIPKYLYTVNIYWGIPILISLFISVVAGAIGFFISWQKSVFKQEQLKNEVLNYKYEALKNQINPHFMFNSLNVLSDLVYDDQKLAIKFIHQFSDIYRYVLENRERELVSLEEELEFIKKFIFLLKIRFDQKLEVEIDVPFNKDELIVPLALQLLIENAVKHNEISSQNKLTITIKKDAEKIVISNPIQLKNNPENSKKIGLKNLEQQYQYFTDMPVKWSGNNGLFKIEIPVLKQLAE